jgi:hypothetical protein
MAIRRRDRNGRLADTAGTGDGEELSLLQLSDDDRNRLVPAYNGIQQSRKIGLALRSGLLRSDTIRMVLDRQHEAIAPQGDGFDRALGFLAPRKDFPKSPHVYAYVGFLDLNVAPHEAHQVADANNLPGVQHEQVQYVKSPSADCDMRVIKEQRPSLWIKAKTRERVTFLGCFCCHGPTPVEPLCAPGKLAAGESRCIRTHFVPLPPHRRRLPRMLGETGSRSRGASPAWSIVRGPANIRELSLVKFGYPTTQPSSPERQAAPPGLRARAPETCTRSVASCLFVGFSCE